MNKTLTGDECPYMDTIDRKSLDFDFEKVCSVSLSPHNVYACLICGVFFTGRSKNTHAYIHSLHSKHHLYIHLENGKIYCLPDGYCVEDPSLEDIQQNLNPIYTKQEILELDTNTNQSYALDGSNFLPGRIGMNNLGNTGQLNSIIQCLLSVRPLRNYFVSIENYKNSHSPLVRCFGELTRKFFNARNFKGQISPHELLQRISDASDKRFKIGNICDPLNFLIQFLNTLHRDLGGNKKRKSSIISRTFQGYLNATHSNYIDDLNGLPQFNEIENDSDDNLNSKKRKFDIDYANISKKSERISFLYLSFNLPDTPLFRGEETEDFIPQVPITDLLKKFNGRKRDNTKKGRSTTYRLSRLPPYLIIHLKRFKQNEFQIEKNPTIVNFPLKNLDLKEYLDFDGFYNESQLKHKTVEELRTIIKTHCLSSEGCLEKSDLIRIILEAQPKIETIATRYNLIGNIIHEGNFRSKRDKIFALHATDKTFGNDIAYVLHKPNNQWYKTHDLDIIDTVPQMVTVSESYIQFWELNTKFQ